MFVFVKNSKPIHCKIVVEVYLQIKTITIKYKRISNVMALAWIVKLPNFLSAILFAPKHNTHVN